MEIVSKGERTKQLGGEAYFIRAPAVVECGPAVATLARTTSAAAAAEGGVGVAVEQRPHILGTAFHPEISADPSWLRYDAMPRETKCNMKPCHIFMYNYRVIHQVRTKLPLTYVKNEWCSA